jgi:hypothetical protein
VFALLDDDMEKVISLMEEAAKEQNSWGYNTPQQWSLQATNACLGVAYLRNNQSAKAYESFQADLAYLPRNPYGLFGLYQAMEQQNDKYTQAELKQALSDAETAWERGDLDFASPCNVFDLP